MKKYSYIYGLVDPRNNRIRYIGKSINPWKRFSNHSCPSSLNKSLCNKNKWIKKLISLKLKPKLIILCKCLNKNTDIKEKYYISYYKNKGYKLVNERPGGEGWPSGKKLRECSSYINGVLAVQKSVTIRDSKTNLEKIFNSVKETAKYLKTNPCTVSTYLKHPENHFTLKGHYIRYTGTPFIKRDRERIPLKATNINTGEILYFESFWEAKNKGFNSRSIKEIVYKTNKNRHTHKGYEWVLN